MLQAILHGKADHIEQDGKSLRWRDLFNPHEDLLTAAFFGRVPYLSDRALGALIRFLLGDDNPIDPTTFVKLELWPHLKFTKRGHLYIEPDVLLHFAKALVVIEVKLPFKGNQDRVQWNDQTEAVIDDGELKKYGNRLYYVALGGNVDAPLTRPDLPERFLQMTQREWEPLRYFLQTAPEFDSRRQDKAIREDWMQVFELIGMAPAVPDWQPLLDYPAEKKVHLDCGVMSGWEPVTPTEHTAD